MTERKCSNLWLYFAGVIFATVTAVFLLTATCWFTLFKIGIVEINPTKRHLPILICLAGSLLLGAVVAFFVGKLIIRPVQSVGDAFESLSRGNFDVRVSEDDKIVEIREIKRKFNAMVRDLSNIETLRSDFTANVSHEFKTPLSSIEGYATLLCNPDLSEEKKMRYIQKIIDNSRKLSTLTSDILLLSKIENQEFFDGNCEFRLDEQIRKCILMLEYKWSAKEIYFDIDMEKTVYYGNEALLERVWINIIDNAIKFSNPSSQISVKAERIGDSLSVKIRDFGVGMDGKTQKRIFEKFYQSDSSRREEGNGLGLALVRRIVDLCKGSIEVESALDEGTEITVTLPTSNRSDFQ